MFLSILLLVCALATNSLADAERSYYTWLNVDNGQGWGTWSYLDMCPSGTYAGGFRIRVERDQGKGDDTALNGIKLECVKGDSTSTTVTSNDGFWGDWSGVRWCTPGGKLVSFQLNVEVTQHSGDDTAANDINFKCSSGEVLYGSGKSWGYWAHWSEECPSGGICGIRTSVERRQGEGDDTALNDVQFVCCY